MGFFDPFGGNAGGSGNEGGQIKIEVDKTLSKEGMAADSKTVGDRVNTINEKIRILEEAVLGNNVLIVDDITGITYQFGISNGITYFREYNGEVN